VWSIGAALRGAISARHAPSGSKISPPHGIVEPARGQESGPDSQLKSTRTEARIPDSPTGVSDTATRPHPSSAARRPSGPAWKRERGMAHAVPVSTVRPPGGPQPWLTVETGTWNCTRGPCFHVRPGRSPPPPTVETGTWNGTRGPCFHGPPPGRSPAPADRGNGDVEWHMRSLFPRPPREVPSPW
jgi:hypothetical protein